MEVLSAVFILCLSKISSAVQPYVHSTPFHPKIFHYIFASFFITVVDPTVFQGQNEFQFFAFSLKWMGVVWYFLVCLYQAKIKLQLRWNSASFLMTLSGGGTWTSLSKHLKIVDFRHISSPTSKLQNKEIWTFLPCISQMYLEILFERLEFVHSKNGCFMVSFIFSLVITQL